jgi:hypothetical protein
LQAAYVAGEIHTGNGGGDQQARMDDQGIDYQQLKL